MGLLDLFGKSEPILQRLPSGSICVDHSGKVLASTLSSGCPAESIQAIVAKVLRTFESAASAQLPLAELRINYPSFQITARYLRGGAILFLAPQNRDVPTSQS
jgi:hypothetical protein